MKTFQLTASASFGNGGKQFIARISGRDSKYTFNREFIGRREGKRLEDARAAEAGEQPRLISTVADISKESASKLALFAVKIPEAIGDFGKWMEENSATLSIYSACGTWRATLESKKVISHDDEHYERWSVTKISSSVGDAIFRVLEAAQAIRSGKVAP